MRVSNPIRTSRANSAHSGFSVIRSTSTSSRAWILALMWLLSKNSARYNARSSRANSQMPTPMLRKMSSV